MRPWLARLAGVDRNVARESGAKKTTSENAPKASSQPASRPVIQRAKISILRLTPPARPAGMQAAIATANAIEVISLSATTPPFASQRSMTSITVALAAISIPSTPSVASGRVAASSHRSSRSKNVAWTPNVALTPVDVIGALFPVDPVQQAPAIGCGRHASSFLSGWLSPAYRAIGKPRWPCLLRAAPWPTRCG